MVKNLHLQKTNNRQASSLNFLQVEQEIKQKKKNQQKEMSIGILLNKFISKLYLFNLMGISFTYFSPEPGNQNK